MGKILQLAPYPIRRPLHGGQHRVRAIRDRLVAEGHTVRTVSVVVEGFYPGEDHDSHTVVVPRESLQALAIPPDCYDLGLNRLLKTDATLLQSVRAAVGRFVPDVIVLEQPWLQPVVEHIGPDVPLVYSSQNVESTLKRAILREQAAVRPAIAEVLVAEIEAVELATASAADLVVTVSDEDATWYSRAAGNVVVAKNGASIRKAVPAIVQEWRTATRDVRIALFVGSSHPPNADGFWQMLGPSLGFLPPTARIVVVGGVCSTLLSHPLSRFAPASNAARLDLLGSQTEGALGALFEVADCIVLPIVAGGGTNLKTAEALLSRKTLIATTKALRGFEQFAVSDGVVVADSAEDFRRATLHALTTADRFNECERPEAKQLFWESTLEPFTTAIRQLPARSTR